MELPLAAAVWENKREWKELIKNPHAFTAGGECLCLIHFLGPFFNVPGLSYPVFIKVWLMAYKHNSAFISFQRTLQLFFCCNIQVVCRLIE